MGSAAAEAGDSKHGYRNLVRALKRIFVNHGSPGARSDEIARAISRGGKARHYQYMYDIDDSSLDHDYALVSYLRKDEMLAILNHAMFSEDKELLYAENLERQALIQIFEGISMILMGFYTGIRDLVDKAKTTGFAPPKIPFRSHNSSPGFDFTGGTHATLVERHESQV